MKKRGFTLIEMVIVITVLGLLMAFLIPKITEAQAKARDIRRQSDITMIAAALVSYKHDHGEFPQITTGICVTNLRNSYLSGYLSNIPQDPSGKGSNEKWTGRTRGSSGYVCETGYGYIGSGLNFLIIYSVDEYSNGNYLSSGNKAADALRNNNLIQFKQGLKESSGGSHFVYIYK